MNDVAIVAVLASAFDPATSPSSRTRLICLMEVVGHEC